MNATIAERSENRERVTTWIAFVGVLALGLLLTGPGWQEVCHAADKTENEFGLGEPDGGDDFVPTDAAWLPSAKSDPAPAAPAPSKPEPHPLAAGKKGGTLIRQTQLPAPKGAVSSIGIRQVRFSPDGKWLLLGTGHQGQVTDVASGAVRTTIQPPAKDHAMLGWNVGPGGKSIYSLSAFLDKRQKKILNVQLIRWDAETGRQTRAWPLPDNLIGSSDCVAVSPDGHWVALGLLHFDAAAERAYPRPYVVNLKTGKSQAVTLPELKGNAIFEAVQFSHDGKTLYALAFQEWRSDRKTNRATHLAQWPTGQWDRAHLQRNLPLVTRPDQQSNNRLSIDPGGKWFLCLPQVTPQIQLLPTAAGQNRVLRIPSTSRTGRQDTLSGGLALDADRFIFAFQYKGVFLWNAPKQTCSVRFKDGKGKDVKIYAMAVSPAGGLLAAMGDQKYNETKMPVYVWATGLAAKTRPEPPTVVDRPVKPVVEPTPAPGISAEAKRTLAILQAHIQLYKATTGRLPGALKDLLKGDLKSIPPAPSGYQYRYTPATGELAYAPLQRPVIPTSPVPAGTVEREVVKDFGALELALRTDAPIADHLERICRSRLPIWRQAAASGNADGLLFIGLCHKHGKGYPKDEAKALAYFHAAAKSKHAMAMYYLGYMHKYGQGTSKNDAEAAKWFAQAAEKGHARAMCRLGWYCQMGRGVPRDTAKAVSWYRKAADLGSAQGMYHLGVCREDAQGVRRDYAKAAAWHLKAAKLGHRAAMYNLGRLYAAGNGVEQDYVHALSCHHESAARGFAPAMTQLGLFYLRGLGVRRSHALALKWFRQGAKSGNALSMRNLAIMHRLGMGVPKSDVEANQWDLRAAKSGNANAMWNMFSAYKNGTGTAKDAAKALMWLRRAARAGHAGALKYAKSNRISVNP